MRRNTEKSARDKLLEEIALVKAMLQNANTRFELESDCDLVESAIYEIESLKARYRYLMRAARAFDNISA